MGKLFCWYCGQYFYSQGHHCGLSLVTKDKAEALEQMKNRKALWWLPKKNV